MCFFTSSIEKDFKQLKEVNSIKLKVEKQNLTMVTIFTQFYYEVIDKAVQQKESITAHLFITTMVLKKVKPFHAWYVTYVL
jgi:hypothetical protein